MGGVVVEIFMSANTVDPKEVARYLHNFSSMPSWNGTVNQATARELLKHECVFCRGDIRDIRTKHLGLGVYKVYTEPKPL